MLTVQELHRQREARARVNHETYKQLWRQVQDRIRARADNRATDLVWQVPPLVPGRPVYTVAHAARYVSDKLRHGGFVVTVAAPQPDVHVMHIDWAQRPGANAATTRPPSTRPKAKRSRAQRPQAAEPPCIDDASRTLEKLKARLRLS